MTPAEREAHIDAIWQMLATGAANRRSPVHTPAVANIGSNGAPQQRVMVLREADHSIRRLRFHTDLRSAKVGELAQQCPISVLTYDAEARIQLRLSGVGEIDGTSAQCDAAWSAATNFAKRCYLAQPGPGTPVDHATSGLPPDVEGRVPLDEELPPARANFALLLVTVQQIDWLFLNSHGHRRARFAWNDAADEWSGQYLVP